MINIQFDDGSSIVVPHVRAKQDEPDIREGCDLIKRMTFSPEEYKERINYFVDCVKFLWNRSGSECHVSMLCSAFFLCGCSHSILDLWDVYLEFAKEFDEYENANWYVSSDERPRLGRVDLFQIRERQVTDRFKTALVCALVGNK